MWTSDDIEVYLYPQIKINELFYISLVRVSKQGLFYFSLKRQWYTVVNWRMLPLKNCDLWYPKLQSRVKAKFIVSEAARFLLQSLQFYFLSAWGLCTHVQLYYAPLTHRVQWNQITMLISVCEQQQQKNVLRCTSFMRYILTGHFTLPLLHWRLFLCVWQFVFITTRFWYNEPDNEEVL